MQVYEAAKILGIESKEFCSLYGLKNHLSKLPKKLKAELFGNEKKIMEKQTLAPAVDKSEAPTITIDPPKKEECPIGMKDLELAIRLLGAKSPYFKWKHLLNG